MGIKQELLDARDAVAAALHNTNTELSAWGVPTASTLSEVPDKFAAVHAAGRQAECDAFWDLFQGNGTRTSYANEFSGDYWTDEIFKPKYPIVIVGNAQQAFYACHATVLPVALDTSGCTGMNYLFCGSKFKALPVIDARGVDSATTINTALYNCTDLESIEKVYLHGGSWGTSSFTRLSALREIRVEGTFVVNLDMHWSPLSKASIESIVAALSDSVTGQVLTLSGKAVATAFETSESAGDGSTSDEWTALIATKANWTVTLA